MIVYKAASRIRLPGFYAYDTFDYIETRLGIKKKPPEL